MEIREKIAAVEAILFACGESVEIQKIAEILELSQERVSNYINLLNQRYEDCGSGIQIISINKGYQMTTRKEYAEYIRKAIDVKKSAPLSQAALEVLTIIAYNQPVSKGFIENIRGTDSSSIVNNLVEKSLIEEAGRIDVPGRPIAYKTTDVFLRSFGLESLDALPPLPDKNKLDAKESIK